MAKLQEGRCWGMELLQHTSTRGNQNCRLFPASLAAVAATPRSDTGSHPRSTAAPTQKAGAKG